MDSLSYWSCTVFFHKGNHKHGKLHCGRCWLLWFGVRIFHPLLCQSTWIFKEVWYLITAVVCKLKPFVIFVYFLKKCWIDLPWTAPLNQQNITDWHQCSAAEPYLYVWCFSYVVSQWGWLVSAFEWCVFVCNHNSRGDNWKNSFTTSPQLIQAIMANGKQYVTVSESMCGHRLHKLMWTVCLWCYQGFGRLWACGWWVGCTASHCGCTGVSGVYWPTGSMCLPGSRLWGPCCWLQAACWLYQLR